MKPGIRRFAIACGIAVALNPAMIFAKDFTMTSASWSSGDNHLTISGTSEDRASVTLKYPGDRVSFATVRASPQGNWSIGVSAPSPVPCRVRAETKERSSERDVQNAPANCSNTSQPPANQSPTANANGPYSASANVTINFSSAGSSDGDGSIVSYAWNFGDGATSSSANPTHSYTANGSYTVSLVVIDNGGATGNASTVATISDTPPPAANVSINSVSSKGIPGTPVAEQPFVTNNSYKVFAVNDLGMHCGDLDTRLSGILPPFNVLHAQVIRTGSTPTLLGESDGIELVYSAASNPNDPILSGLTSTGLPVVSSMMSDGSVYKTNYWDIALQAYDPFYPAGILPLFLSNGDKDVGLPMPDVEELFLGSGNLAADQQAMPGRSGPYVLNDPTRFTQFVNSQPFFINFPFGYTSHDVNWFEAAGIPLTAFDDYGRENPWPLYRVQAKAGGNVLASIDTVVPISGEANCGACHNDPVDGGNGEATADLSNVATVLDDPELTYVPLLVSKEYAADLNILRLHDQKHGTQLENEAPVVCQRCHYTPALDLAHLGPYGPENDGPLVLNGVQISDSIANGRDQIKNKSMSNVMHGHHATTGLFPDMPPPVNADGSLRGGYENPMVEEILNNTCYQCHPGRRTDCLRGAMANGGMVCQDCHGNMAQVGNDFSRNVSPANPGAFELASDFYNNPATARVPWANEPGCGSCHTGDFNDNLHGSASTVGAPDGIRLMQAYRSGDSKATPIVPSNHRFGENIVAASDPGAGNPMLYRVSKGHGDVFCEACHGSTHGEWPNKNPGANDNVAAMQLQGHTGVIVECATCHAEAMNSRITLDGPHGMHPVGNDTSVSNGSASGPRVSFVDGGHENLAENNSAACAACHGPGNRGSNQGTVLSVAKKDRRLNGQLIAKGTPIGCSVCHSGNDD